MLATDRLEWGLISHSLNVARKDLSLAASEQLHPQAGMNACMVSIARQVTIEEFDHDIECVARLRHVGVVEEAMKEPLPHM